ncbi:MAG TPA: LysR family transcriptional regulator [Jiangellaceae bacterium]|nr:LysR family transcriptional regulator [Jiangellaceae bacterium]
MSATTPTRPVSWPGLELRHLVALVAVAEAGTFSRAADELGYTQSAVSQQVGSLERIVGTSLFERPGGPRPVRLTTAGQMLLSHARAVLARVSSAAADLRAVASGEQGELRVGTLPSIGTKVLPRLLSAFRADWPLIQVVLRESRDCADLIRAVEAGDIDVTFIDIGPYETGPLEVRELLADPMVFLAPVGAFEARQQAVGIADIAHLPMIGTRNPGCRQIIDDAFRQAPSSPTYVFRSDDHPTIQGLIGSGLAYAVLPLLTVDENDPKVAVLPIRPETTPRRLGIAWHPERRLPSALMPFVAAATEVCHDLQEHWVASHAAQHSSVAVRGG